jgi:hypothetical protein
MGKWLETGKDMPCTKVPPESLFLEMMNRLDKGHLFSVL